MFSQTIECLAILPLLWVSFHSFRLTASTTTTTIQNVVKAKFISLVQCIAAYLSMPTDLVVSHFLLPIQYVHKMMHITENVILFCFSFYLVSRNSLLQKSLRHSFIHPEKSMCIFSLFSCIAGLLLLAVASHYTLFCFAALKLIYHLILLLLTR